MVSELITPVAALKILKERKIELIKNNKFPYTLLRMSLYKEFSMKNIKPALVTLVKTKQIKMHHTVNDVGFDIPISGRYREIEDEMLRKCNFKTL